MSVSVRLAVCLGLFSLPTAALAQPAWQRLATSESAPEALGRAVIVLASMERAGALRPIAVSADTTLTGRHHEFLEQYHRGHRVVGAGVRRQKVGDQVISVFGAVLAGLDVPATIHLSAEQAADTAARATSGRPRGEAELVVWTPYSPSTASPTYAYEVTLATVGDVERVWVDAATGKVLARRGSRRTQAIVGGGAGVLGDRKKLSTTPRSGMFFAIDSLRSPALVTYDLRGATARTLALLEGTIEPSLGDVASDADNQWQDGATVDAHAYLGRTYDYLLERFGRQGLDGASHPIRAIVHPASRVDLLTDPDAILDLFTNAFWCGSCGHDGQGMLLFGEGLPPGVELSNGQSMDFFSAAIDVVAHELAHGVTEYTSRLEYEGESGALNEAFSDIIGVGAEFFAQPAGAGFLQADYLVGEDVVRPGGLRTIADPLSQGDPDHYTIRYRGSDDHGGVHTNSTIVSHAFFLSVEGGVNRTSGIRVAGVGAGRRDRIEQTFYRAFVHFLSPRATFADARTATRVAARELYGAGSDVERAIEEAWTAVGVGVP